MTIQPGRAEAVVRRLPADRPTRGVEVGVARGVMSAALLRALPLLYLVMVDSWLGAPLQPSAYRATGDRHAQLEEREQLAQRRQAELATRFADHRRQILPIPSAQAAQACADAAFDFVFLDGDHSLAGVRADLELWRPKVRPGGWLCGHDYLRTDAYPFGVVDAVNEAVQRHDWTLETAEDFTWFVRVGEEA